MVKEITKEDRAKAISILQEKLGGEWLEPEHITELLKESIQEDHHLRGIEKVYWSLGCCQGDGVAFEGQLDLDELRKHQPELDGMIRDCEALAALLGCDYDLEVVCCEVSHSGRYCHQNSMNLEIEWNAGSGCQGLWEECEGDYSPLDRWLSQVNDWLEGYIEDVSRALAKMGYAEIEYQGSEEYAIEYLDCNPHVLDHLL